MELKKLATRVLRHSIAEVKDSFCAEKFLQSLPTWRQNQIWQQQPQDLREVIKRTMEHFTYRKEDPHKDRVDDRKKPAREDRSTNNHKPQQQQKKKDLTRTKNPKSSIIICWNYREVGHSKFNCPKHKINHVLKANLETEEKEKNPWNLEGMLNGYPSQHIILDSGTAWTVVKEDFALV